MSTEEWQALEANPLVRFSATGSWLESDNAKPESS